MILLKRYYEIKSDPIGAIAIEQRVLYNKESDTYEYREGGCIASSLDGLRGYLVAMGYKKDENANEVPGIIEIWEPEYKKRRGILK